ncbi:hypothetical protein [Georgenia yuyongxinii]|uniref:Uncharacterized protein n=1 Tax=Georgenia yuyongxinii TaxID=2589797 RepID=A0A552WUJ7_9MICO|nr:hypothetical protein [Georgenia yuyongxinii]TRW46521.1 hypothetical protein FJ693_05245 [Georgenia yuyongxinii]
MDDRDGASTRGVARVARGLSIVALAVALTGCANATDLDGRLAAAAWQAASAASSAALGLELYLDGSVTATVADVTFIDMTREAGAAQESVTAQAVATTAEAARRDRLRTDIGGATDDILRARALVAGAVPAAEGPTIAAALQDRAEGLTATADRLDAG